MSPRHGSETPFGVPTLCGLPTRRQHGRIATHLAISVEGSTHLLRGAVRSHDRGAIGLMVAPLAATGTHPCVLVPSAVAMHRGSCSVSPLRGGSGHAPALGWNQARRVSATSPVVTPRLPPARDRPRRREPCPTWRYPASSARGSRSSRDRRSPASSGSPSGSRC